MARRVAPGDAAAPQAAAVPVPFPLVPTSAPPMIALDFTPAEDSPRPHLDARRCSQRATKLGTEGQKSETVLNRKFSRFSLLDHGGGSCNAFRGCINKAIKHRKKDPVLALVKLFQLYEAHGLLPDVPDDDGARQPDQSNGCDRARSKDKQEKTRTYIQEEVAKQLSQIDDLDMVKLKERQQMKNRIPNEINQHPTAIHDIIRSRLLYCVESNDVYAREFLKEVFRDLKAEAQGDQGKDDKEENGEDDDDDDFFAIVPHDSGFRPRGLCQEEIEDLQRKSDSNHIMKWVKKHFETYFDGNASILPKLVDTLMWRETKQVPVEVFKSSLTGMCHHDMILALSRVQATEAEDVLDLDATKAIVYEAWGHPFRMLAMIDTAIEAAKLGVVAVISTQLRADPPEVSSDVMAWAIVFAAKAVMDELMQLMFDIKTKWDRIQYDPDLKASAGKHRLMDVGVSLTENVFDYAFIVVEATALVFAAQGSMTPDRQGFIALWAGLCWLRTAALFSVFERIGKRTIPIILTIMDIAPFLIIFLVGVAAATNMIFILGTREDPPSNFYAALMLTYRLAILADVDRFEVEGTDTEFAQSAEGMWQPVDPDPTPKFGWVMFWVVLTSGVLTTILLQLLVSVLGSSYDRFEATATSAFIKNRTCAMIRLRSRIVFNVLNLFFRWDEKHIDKTLLYALPKEDKLNFQQKLENEFSALKKDLLELKESVVPGKDSLDLQGAQQVQGELAELKSQMRTMMKLMEGMEERSWSSGAAAPGSAEVPPPPGRWRARSQNAKSSQRAGPPAPGGPPNR